MVEKFKENSQNQLFFFGKKRSIFGLIQLVQRIFQRPGIAE